MPIFKNFVEFLREYRIIAISVAFGFSIARNGLNGRNNGFQAEHKQVILRFALVSDSENENDFSSSIIKLFSIV